MPGRGGPTRGTGGLRLRQSRERWWCERVGTGMGMGMRTRAAMRSKCRLRPQPPTLPLPEGLHKALGKDSTVCRKAAAAP